MTKEKFRKVECFLSLYNQKCRELALLSITYNNYANVDIDEEIESRSLSHPAEEDNIGAGRNLTISKKTENIALSIDNFADNMLKEREQLKPKIYELQTETSIINIFADNLSEINSIIFKSRFMDKERKTFNDISNIVNVKCKKSLSEAGVRKRYINVVSEFADIAYKYINCI